MGKQITLDDDIAQELVRRAVDDEVMQALIIFAIESNKSSKLVNDALRGQLKMTGRATAASRDNYPTSRVIKVQKLLEGLRDTAFSISGDGLERKGKKWVANPNVVTITVQDARARNLRITVYGRPDEFVGIKGSIEIKPDMSGYSRFIIDSESQLPLAKKVIEHSYKLKSDRGRL